MSNMEFDERFKKVIEWGKSWGDEVIKLEK